MAETQGEMLLITLLIFVVSIVGIGLFERRRCKRDEEKWRLYKEKLNRKSEVKNKAYAVEMRERHARLDKDYEASKIGAWRWSGDQRWGDWGD